LQPLSILHRLTVAALKPVSKAGCRCKAAVP